MQEFVEGWTEPIEYDLKKNGAVFDATGMTVDLVLTDRQGNVVDTTGDIVWANQAASRVRYSPDASDFTGKATLSPLRMRWKVTDGAGKSAFFPRGVGEDWIIRKP